jgi:pimeloyl-ACP methyl ester carboxylesterase
VVYKLSEENRLSAVHHRYATIDGHNLFYREAGPSDAPAVVLLHGFPSSSYMFRDLLPKLAGRYRVIAPDHLGFGLSDAPSVEQFDYTFDALADLTAKLLTYLGLTRYAMYVHDYGAPIGWRLAVRTPASVAAIITQNGNGYGAGFIEDFWKPITDYWNEQTPETESAVRAALSLDLTKWLYVTGEPDETLINPESWDHDFALISRPGNDKVQLKLFLDYASNPRQYPALHSYFRESQVPLLAVWGRGDESFAPAGARAFTTDLPHAEVHLLEGGHFLLESAAEEVAALIHRFLGALEL